MKTDFTEQAHAEMCWVIGAAVVQLVAGDGVVSRETIAKMVAMQAGDGPDLAVEFALDLLR